MVQHILYSYIIDYILYYVYNKELQNNLIGLLMWLIYLIYEEELNMRKFFKIGTAFLLAAASIIGTAGCGAESSQRPAPGNGASGDGKVKLRVLTRYAGDITAEEKVFIKRLEEFKTQNPDIEVINESVNDETAFNNKFKTDVATGELPNIFLSYGGAAFEEYATSGLVYNLADAFETDPAWGDKFIPSMLDAWSFESGVYGVPFAGYATALYYNKEIFNNLGIEVPTTIAEFETVSEILVDNGYTPLAIGDKEPHRGAHLITNLIMKKEGFGLMEELANRTTTWEDQRVVSILEQLKLWGDKGYLGDNIVTLDPEGGKAMFLNEEAAMHFDGSWFLGQVADSQIKDNIGVVPFPYYEDKPELKNNWHGGASDGLAVAHSDDPAIVEASLKLFKYLTDMTTYDELFAMSGGGVFPVSGIKVPDEISPLSKEFESIFVDVGDIKNEPGEYDPNPSVRDTIRDNIQGMWAGMGVEDTAKAIADVIANE